MTSCLIAIHRYWQSFLYLPWSPRWAALLPELGRSTNRSTETMADGHVVRLAPSGRSTAERLFAVAAWREVAGAWR
jgi:hypothetical protein